MHLRLSVLFAAVSVIARNIFQTGGFTKMTRLSFVSTAGCLLLMASGLAGQDILAQSIADRWHVADNGLQTGCCRDADSF